MLVPTRKTRYTETDKISRKRTVWDMILMGYRAFCFRIRFDVLRASPMDAEFPAVFFRLCASR